MIMNVVAYGAGTNSTAMIIGMYHKNIPVDLILFADPGGEQPHTYAYLPIMNDWLVRHGLPEIQTVFYRDKDRNRLTLEQECLRSGTLPAIAYGYKKCSLKHKIDPPGKVLQQLPALPGGGIRLPPRAAMYGKQLRKFGESLRKTSVRNDRRFSLFNPLTPRAGFL